MVKPLSPSELVSSKIGHIPEEVIQAVNEALIEQGSIDYIVLYQNDIIKRALVLGRDTIFKGLKDQKARELMFKKHWLDFENNFKEVGWKVEYDKPGYNETYEANWKFTR